MKEFETELQKLLKRAYDSDSLVNNLRYDFLKEICLLKQLSQPSQLPIDEIKAYLKIHFFNETEGLDPHIIEALNYKLTYMLCMYNQKMDMKEKSIETLKKRLLKFSHLDQDQSFPIKNLFREVTKQNLGIMHIWDEL